MPVTHGVAGSSPVQTAKKGLIYIDETFFFIYAYSRSPCFCAFAPVLNFRSAPFTISRCFIRLLQFVHRYPKAHLKTSTYILPTAPPYSFCCVMPHPIFRQYHSFYSFLSITENVQQYDNYSYNVGLPSNRAMTSWRQRCRHHKLPERSPQYPLRAIQDHCRRGMPAQCASLHA